MEIFLMLLAIVLGFSIVVISVPPILRVARQKQLFDSVDERKIHASSVPPLGGVAIFLGFVLSTIVSTDGYSFDSLKYIIASIILMFFIGLKDDMLVISARNKFVVQVFAAALLITLGNLQITSLHGIFGIYGINHISGIIFSLFIILAIVNAFNLIDGIDGLASGLAILASFVFGAWFFIAGHIQFAIMSLALTGSLAGFFIFNVFGQRNKLFMGDTGSLVIGLIVSVLVIKFNEFNLFKTSNYYIANSPAVSFAIVIVPLVDTLRVITIRLLNGKSPFAPDRNHIHYRLLELVPSHFRVSLILISTNTFLIALALFFNHIDFNVSLQFFAVFVLAILFSFIPSWILRYRNKKAAKNKLLANNPL